jgi:hypothetical protein
MINVVDFDRMSPSYESRLAKYMLRGFSIYIPDFDKKKIKKDNMEFSYDVTGLDFLINSYYFPRSRTTYKYISDYNNLGVYTRVYNTNQQYSKAVVDFNNKWIPITIRSPNGEEKEREDISLLSYTIPIEITS